ncbi:hypothetical protein DPMN_054995 [Dreissena polymorpha]|uniref:Uncharacterized protein n=1 Tax=Dreissena polymorpha TaxID=45954 RepID=A0A9D4CPY0_DREPO|nr:hypothetical protein DPMN_054995 [Dreissena polymorpha]
MPKNNKNKGTNQHTTKSTANMDVTQTLNNTINTTEILGQTREILYGNPSLFTNQNLICDIENSHGAPSTRQCQEQGHTMHSNMCPPSVYPMLGQPQHNQHYGTFHNGAQSASIHNPYFGSVQTTDSNSFPPWAINLCNQMTRIQSTLDMHTNRWKSIETLIVSQTEKLTQLEQTVSEIPDLKRKMENANTNVKSLQTDVKTLSAKMAEYDLSIQQYSDMCDDITGNNNDFEKSLSNVEQEIGRLHCAHDEVTTKLNHTEERVTDVQWRGMRENLLFIGIKEATNYATEGKTVSR